MLKEFIKICSAINTFSRKDDKRMTQSIESHMSNYNIEIYSEDTIDKIANKFDIKLNDTIIKTFNDFMDKDYNNSTVDRFSFMCYFIYSIYCIITDKKINLSLDLSIGEYSLFKKSILDKVN